MSRDEALSWLFEKGWCNTELHLSDNGGFYWARTMYDMNGKNISSSFRIEKELTEPQLSDLASKLSHWIDDERDAL